MIHLLFYGYDKLRGIRLDERMVLICVIGAFLLTAVKVYCVLTEEKKKSLLGIGK